MFKQDSYYRHKRFLDVCFRVHKVEYCDEESLSIDLSWYHVKNLMPFCLSETVNILRSELKNYGEIQSEVHTSNN